MPSVGIAGPEQFGAFRRAAPYDPLKILGKIIILQMIHTALLVLLTWSISPREQIIQRMFDPGALLSPQRTLTLALYTGGSLLVALIMYTPTKLGYGSLSNGFGA